VDAVGAAAGERVVAGVSSAGDDAPGRLPGNVATSFPQHSVIRGLFVSTDPTASLEPAYFYLGDCDARVESGGCWGGCAWDDELGTVCVGNQV
jgi:hypothetical protein